MGLMRLFFLSLLISGCVLQTSGFAESVTCAEHVISSEIATGSGPVTCAESVISSESATSPRSVMCAQPVICDPLQVICMKMEIAIEEPILASLQEMGITVMTLT